MENNKEIISLEKSIVNLFQSYYKDDEKDLSLVWNIGEILRKYLQHIDDEKYGNDLISKIVDGVKQRFTQSSEKKLRQYISFANSFPDVIYISSLPSFIDWGYIDFLLTLGDDNLRCYYLTLSIYHKWSLEKLKKEVAKSIEEMKEKS